MHFIYLSLFLLNGCGLNEEKVCSAFFNGFYEAQTSNFSCNEEISSWVPEENLADCSCPPLENLSSLSREEAFKQGARKFCLENIACSDCDEFVNEIMESASFVSQGASIVNRYGNRYDDCRNNQHPIGTITSHSDGDEIVEGVITEFVGNVSDSDDRPEDLLVTWYSGKKEGKYYVDIEVICLTSSPAADGTTKCEGSIEWSNTLILSVRDSSSSWGWPSAGKFANSISDSKVEVTVVSQD